MIKFFLAILFLAQLINCFDYEANGPDIWFKQYPTCAGSRQSPINIETEDLHYDRSLKNFKLNQYNQVINWIILFTGFNSYYKEILTAFWCNI